MNDEKRTAERELAEACRAVLDKLAACLALEDDHIMQHSLTTLKGECEWCVREFQ